MNALLSGLRRRWKWLATIAALLLLYTLAGFLLVPHVARSAISDYVTQKLGRQVDIGELHFNPYTFVVRVTDFHLREADGAPLLGFKSLLVNADPLNSIFARAIVLQELHLVEPDIAVVINADGSINLAKLAPPAGEPEPQPAQAQPLPRIRIGALAVDDGRVAFEDRSRPQAFAAELKPIRFALTEFRTEADYENAYRFDATTAAGERFDWSGRFTVQPLGSDGEFGVHGLLAKTIASYLQDQLPVQLRSGAIDLQGHYKLALQPTLELGVELPAITLRDFAIAARGSTDTASPVAVKQIGVEGVAFSVARREVSVQAVKVDGAQLAVRREADGSINLMQLLPKSEAAP
ncbi:MAG: DUF748 domain-containing protein, partial [Solimonas sp.]